MKADVCWTKWIEIRRVRKNFLAPQLYGFVYFFKIFPKKCVLIVDMNFKQSRNEKISCVFL